MIYVQSSDNIRLAVFDYQPNAKKTVLLLHGWPFSHEIFEYQIRPLTERGFRVIAMDFRGFGASDSPAFGYGYDQLASDLYRVVTSLSLSSFVLVGFSMGGAVALRYMRLFGGYGVQKLILLAAAAPCFARRPGCPAGMPREAVQALIARAECDRPGLLREFCGRQLLACPHGQPVKDWLEGIALSASGIGTVRAACALRDEDGRGDLSAVAVPAFLLHGRKDAVVSPKLARILCANIRNARLFWLEHSGHAIFYDELEEFNRIFFGCL